MSDATLSVDVARFLLLCGRGCQAKNVSFSVAANTTVSQADNPVAVNGQDAYVLIWSIQFDGVQSGQVGFTFNLEDGSILSGYGVQGLPDEIEVFARNPVTYQVQNGQLTSCVVNIDYISVPKDAHDAVLEAISGLRSGGPSVGVL